MCMPAPGALEGLQKLRGVLSGSTAKITWGKTAQFFLYAGKSDRCAPRTPFGECECGEAPDYKKLDAWLAHPDRPAGVRDIEDANHICAAGSPLPAVDARPCDCFFLVDTCLNDIECMPFLPDSAARCWNLPVGAKEGTTAHQLVAKVKELMEMRVAVGASCVNRTCRVFSPLYRQMSILSLTKYLPDLIALTKKRQPRPFQGRPEDMCRSFDLAYDDVLSAFTEFVDHPSRAGRPFILVGHSQGSLHLVRLLQEEIENHPQRRSRFVHAYLTGTFMPMDLFSRTLRNVRPCAHAADICTISSWNTLSCDHRGHTVFRGVTWYGGEGFQPIIGEVLTTNPITWSSNMGSAPSALQEYKGALFPLPTNCDPRDSESGRLPSGLALRWGHTSKRTTKPFGLRIPELVHVDCGELTAKACKDGFIRVPAFPKSSLFSLAERDWLQYHDLDCATFHANIQENVALRVKTWSSPGSRL
mmetsp:Transcript_88601/g.271215  ORF Transcript_88601/g.271215 Transcript_88601/m.271215 type:complete len:473 (-) Transcript_88601:105-1523(-)